MVVSVSIMGLTLGVLRLRLCRLLVIGMMNRVIRRLSVMVRIRVVVLLVVMGGCRWLVILRL